MRQIGHRHTNQPALLPTADALRAAATHQHTGQALAAVSTTGFIKGIYRFATHAEMNRHSEEALARAMAANLRRRDGSGESLEAQ